MLARKALAGAPSVAPLYVTDVYSTTLYTGNGSTQTITNNIDISGKGGAVWIKSRSNAYSHRIGDTERGATKRIIPNSSNAEDDTGTAGITAFTSSGFSIGDDAGVNQSSATYVSWTFREAEKFFDIVTYSGNSVDNRTISHNLGSTPGCVIVRRRSGDNWFVYHRSLSANDGLRLDTTSAASSNTSTVKSVSSTTFTVGTDGMVNTTGSDYVAYLFAHDAGGFGSAGTDSIVYCSTYQGTGSDPGPTVTIGWQPQWLLVKRSSGGTGDWTLYDSARNTSNMRENVLYPNTNQAEEVSSPVDFLSTGFQPRTTSARINANGDNYVYIAIRKAD